MRRTMSLSIEIPNARLICSAIRGQPQTGLRRFISMTARITSASGPFGPGLLLRFGENSNRYFCWTNARWKFINVEGLSVMAVRTRRAGLMNKSRIRQSADPKPEDWVLADESDSE